MSDRPARRRKHAVRSAVAGLVVLGAAVAWGYVGPAANAVVNGGSGTGEPSGSIPVVNGTALNDPSNVAHLTYLFPAPDGDGLAQWHCSAVIFNDYWALTARHCFNDAGIGEGEAPDEGKLSVTFGDNRTFSFDIASVHTEHGHDLAMVRLAQPFSHEPGAQKGHPRPHNLRLAGQEAATEGGAVAYGYGKTCADGNCGASGTVKAAGVVVTGRGTAESGGSALIVKPEDYRVPYNNGSSVLYRKGTVTDGDSGGPLVVDSTVVGILSNGDEDEALYTEVAPHLDWILDLMNF